MVIVAQSCFIWMKFFAENVSFENMFSSRKKPFLSLILSNSLA